MRKSTYTFIIILLTTILSSCYIAKDLRTVDTSRVSLGMTKLEVRTALKKDPISTIAAHKDPETNYLVEAVRYDEFLFVFTNDKLQSWEPYRPGY